MRIVRLFSRILLGAVFIFSGFVKAVDPLGSAYKFSDYFHAFGLKFLDGLSLPLGILLPALELALGIMLLLGYRKKIVTWAVTVFMVFFTLLTLVLAIFNPVEDCGCFGDALVLTNWETFFKNVVLMVFVVILFFDRKRECGGGQVAREWIAAALLLMMAIGFSIWNHRHLPLLDFRPYDAGTVIEEEMEIPEGAPTDEYETTLIYREKETGKTSRFTLEDYPGDTTAWEFVTSESKLVRKGYEPPIHDFAIMDPYGSDLAGRIIADKGYSLLVISHDISRAGREGLVKAGDWSRLDLLADDFSFYAVTASPSAEVEEISSSLGLEYGFFAADDIMLKTVVRSNPGFVLIKNGTILGKWGSRDFPSLSEVDPAWPEMIVQASLPVDEETRLLMEGGLADSFSFGVIEFDRHALSMLSESGSAERERWAVVSFLLGIALLIIIFHLVAPIRM